MKVLQFPLARITFGFVLGIIVAFYSKPNPQIAFILLLISFLALLFFIKKKCHSPLYFGLATYFFHSLLV